MKDWHLVYKQFEVDKIGLREALCALGNGYFATRGAAEEVHADGHNYPGTYIAGAYNTLKTEFAGKLLWNEDLVNFPNWLLLQVYPHGCNANWLNLISTDAVDYELNLDMRHGILHRKMEFTDQEGRITRIVSRRVVSMANPHLAGIEYCFIPVNWSGEIIIKSGIDLSITNLGVARYRELNHHHFDVIDHKKADNNCAIIMVNTTQTHLQVAQAIRTRIFCNYGQSKTKPVMHFDKQEYMQSFSTTAHIGEAVKVEKIISLYTSKDFASKRADFEAEQAIKKTGSFHDIVKAHSLAWKQLWQHCDIAIGENNFEQQCIRLHIFHLLQTLSPNTIGLDCGAPARGWHGEAYRGHIFWDELFIIPFYTVRLPQLARSLLMYRYHRLPVARQLAEQNGYKGAMFPWQSAGNGEETSQQWHFNPQSQTWGPDYSSLQRHVNSATAYTIWHYYQHTQDLEFLSTYGAIMILEIARFWASISTYNHKTHRYEIKGVMGPDEYHEKYPNASEPGLNNNAYTNIMAVWVLERALELFEILPGTRANELLEMLNFSNKELARWKHITKEMFVPFHDGVISQFEGYENLKEFAWQEYQIKYGNIERLDRILKSEGDSPDHYKIAKQADVLMLFYLLPFKELQAIFHQLGYSLTQSSKLKTINYYLRRTSHGSTLSKIVISSILAEDDKVLSRELQLQALNSDINDIQGGTTQEGIHLGVMAGSIDHIVKHYAGISISNDVLTIKPWLPKDIPSLSLHYYFRGNEYSIKLTQQSCEIMLLTKALPQIVMICNRKVTLSYQKAKRLSFSN
ncbi:MAG: glycoside hydrolase family 65 protein [Gammaproteobacteria bacterium]|jgi:alpha,alpha-trehalase|nr:glycoside hydrolase family 65 protein [Gammaproteobacteria bacterium]